MIFSGKNVPSSEIGGNLRVIYQVVNLIDVSEKF